MMKRLFITTVAVLAALMCSAQENFMQTVRYSEASPAIFKKVVAAMEPYKDEPASDLMVRVAKQFLGTEYVAGTLEVEPEQLTINMDKTDCILFVEMCLAMVQTLQSDDCTFESFCRNTQNLRYRNGTVDGYTSRNHYTSGWILQGVENGVFTEVSKRLGGSKMNQKFNFMSAHPASYKQLDGNDALIAEIRDVEKELEDHEREHAIQERLHAWSKNRGPLIISKGICCRIISICRSKAWKWAR